MGIDDLMTLDVARDERRDDAGEGQGHDRSDRPEDRCAGQGRAEGDGGMEIHGVSRDLGREQVVLDLLVHDDEPEHPDGVDWIVQQRDQHWQGSGQVGPDGGDELADQPHPDGQRQR